MKLGSDSQTYQWVSRQNNYHVCLQVHQKCFQSRNKELIFIGKSHNPRGKRLELEVARRESRQAEAARFYPRNRSQFDIHRALFIALRQWNCRNCRTTRRLRGCYAHMSWYTFFSGFFCSNNPLRKGFEKLLEKQQLKFESSAEKRPVSCSGLGWWTPI